MKREIADQSSHCVGQLNFAARTGLHAGELVKHLGREDVPPDDSHRRGCLSWRRFLDDAARTHQIASRRLNVEYSVTVGVLARDVLYSYEHPAHPTVGVNQLLEAGGGAHHQVVGKHDSKRIVPDKVARAPNRMPEPKWLLLAGVRHLTWVRQPVLDRYEVTALSTGSELIS
jgi:hypothetical protein